MAGASSIFRDLLSCIYMYLEDCRAGSQYRYCL